MPCYHPVPGWYSRDRNPSGKRSIVFSGSKGFKDRPAQVPCGTCVGCKLERSRQWAVRCMHEAQLYDDNSFVTLTYEVDPGTLVPEHFVGFMKRLRWWLGEERVRFFQCGEYGEKLARPHHHALLFGLRFPDERPYVSGKPDGLRVSEKLDELWSHGRCMIGNVSFESAGYVARYALKKVVGPKADEHYSGRVPEYLTMSRRPGIGRAFVDKYRGEIYDWDRVIVRGAECKPPRYYDNVQEGAAPSVMARIKSRRRVEALRSVDNTGSRLIVREAVKKGALANLRRDL